MRRSLLLATAVLSTHAFAALHLAQPRLIQPLDSDWRFSQSDPVSAQSPAFDDTQWQIVTLPHDWSITGPVKEDAPSRAAGGFFPTGIAWYRKTLTLPNLDPTKRTYIAFDGIMANSDVYCNGELLGHRPYGYVSFNYDLTPHLNAGLNTIAVRVDDSQQPASRWYPGAGINRHVRLITTSAVHIAPWGTFVTTPKLSAQSATVHVRTTIINDSGITANIRLSVSIRTPGDGTLSGSFITLPKPVALAAGATTELEADATIAGPDRWELDHPALYKVVATILENGKPIDDEVVPFGIREFHFDPDQGFFLNGVHHKIYGVALHTDAGALGTAVPLAVWARRFTALRALGVNAIRTAHNPPAPEFLDLADRMGFLVMDEMFDCWTVAKNPYDYHLYFREWSERDEAATIQRDRNHPSIILYSVGNEIHDTPKPDIAIPILKQLVATAHANDPTRPVTQALFRPNVSHDYDNGLADLLDVVGQNYREQEILKAHADKPTRKIIGTENTHDRNQWIAMRDHPEYSGQFLWSGIDYLGEAGRWPSIGAGSGLLLTTSLPRARAFERQSWWSTLPMVRIARRVQAAHRGPVDPGYASPTSNNQQATTNPNVPLDPTTRFGQPLLLDWSPKDQSPHTENIEIYTNAEEVELFLNGKSFGTQQRHADASPIAFQVPFATGTLKAIARTGGKIVAKDELRTAGRSDHLILTTETPTLGPDWNDVAYATATLVDDNGTVVPDTTTVIHFDTSGPGKIIAVDNGNLLDHDPFQTSERKLYEGHAIAILRATASSGAITLTATAEGVTPATIKIAAAPDKLPSTQRSF
ncbi:MAG TPA: glycoside hydrolase family 2 TIM barrel-domain containing protein [Edaphobacter sp.]|nr:glycoside hydrolase family 2 TIM barrel-domain containing protein [Edaphobacter sp.]